MKLLIITQKVDEQDDVLGFFISWIRALSKRVDKVYIICLSKGKYNLPSNVEVISLGKEHGFPKITQAFIFYLNILKFISKIDGIFVHMAPEYVKALYPINFFFTKPIIMWYAHIKVSPNAKWAMKHVDYILTPSKESFEADSQKVISTGHGIDTEAFAPKPSREKQGVVAISRISKVKKIETLIEAVRILKERDVQPVIDMYGKPARPEDDEYLKELKDLVLKYGLGNFHWKGSMANKDTPDVYAGHQVFVRMQGGGGFGKTELEAMSMGMPAIVPTSVYKNELGGFGEELYFDEGDAQALAERIESVLNWDDEKLLRYSELSRKLVVEKHNVENVAEHIVDHIKT
ncbi:MAG: glycosyltransferase family 4 protein [Minisyncoccota bacterium]